MMRFEGTNAIVTGGSRGIGAAVAARLAAEGAFVCVNYVASADAAQAVVDDIVARGGRAEARQGDVADPASVTTLVTGFAEDAGSLDVLVNNAGITRDGLLVRMSDDDFCAVIDTNLTGAFYATRAAGKLMMKARAGSIVNISSVVGITGNAGQAVAAATVTSRPPSGSKSSL